MKMNRKEIYEKIFKLLEKEQNNLLNKYDFGEINLETYQDLNKKREIEYQEYVTDLALCNDKDLKEKMSFVINANLDTF
mgnify:CR=1 FL=1